MADTRTITVHPDKVSETLEAAFPAADAQRVASLGLLAELRQAKAAVYRREAARLRQTHADDDPSVLQAEARAATSVRFAADLRMESTRSQRPQPNSIASARAVSPTPSARHDWPASGGRATACWTAARMRLPSSRRFIRQDRSPSAPPAEW